MSDASFEDELDVEEENDEVPHVEFDITVSPSDPTLELLCQQIERGDIIIPFYQRKFVWKIEQASKLIESFLMGLPVPQIFLYVNHEDQLEVIDGQQRLMSVKYFMDGIFGPPDHRERLQIFKLKGLSQRSEYNSKTFAELSPKDQRKIRNSTLRAINIKQVKPKLNNDSVFHIFERLNTGGTQLKPQEIRNAVFRGTIVDEMILLNSLPDWRGILRMPNLERNQKDIELILRLFALFENWSSYEKPMLKYLNKAMDAEKKFNSEKAIRFKERFPAAVKKVKEAIPNPFRPNRVINAAVLEAVLVTLLENEQITKESLSARYGVLMGDADFKQNTTGGTTDTAMLKARLKAAKRVLVDG